MFNGEKEFLRDFWYVVAPSSALKRGRTLSKRILDEPLLLGRSNDGDVFALYDVCPHRGIPLRYGTFDGREVECCYHGWRFNTEGTCTAIPSLPPDATLNVEKIRVRSYPCREVQGHIWVFFAADPRQVPADLPAIPRLPAIGDMAPQIVFSRMFPCDLDHTAFGLMDPTHAAFVHTSWWWKNKKHRLRLKQKEFEPAPLGWRMKRHRLPPENLMYRLLGRVVTTEISLQLPGLRIESIEGERSAAIAFTAITPLTENETEVHQSLYWTMRGLGFAKPIIKRLAETFLDQDRGVVIKQIEGLAENPNLILIDDADTQAKWFHQIKREWTRSRTENREFRNPVKARTLRWHS